MSVFREVCKGNKIVDLRLPKVHINRSDLCFNQSLFAFINCDFLTGKNTINMYLFQFYVFLIAYLLRNITKLCLRNSLNLQKDFRSKR